MADCKACGYSLEEPSYKYVAPFKDAITKVEEHMQRQCRRCGFSWKEPCLFHEKTDGV